MEHRCSIRKPLELQVLLYKHGLPVQSGTTRNLGLGGVFVEAEAWQWRKHETLEVEFLAVDSSPVMRVTAVVVHLRDGGAGLMFDALEVEQLRQLRTWLLSKDYGISPEPERKLEVA